jgi:hypothetical protein
MRLMASGVSKAEPLFSSLSCHGAYEGELEVAYLFWSRISRAVAQPPISHLIFPISIQSESHQLSSPLPSLTLSAPISKS